MKTKDRNKLIQTANFIEELSWLLKTNRNINIEETVRLLREFYNTSRDSITPQTNFENKRKELLGVLPFLFQDKELFRRNLDIVDFAESLFKIKISRPEKRVRYELIGIIITEVTKIEKDSNLNHIIDALSVISSDVNKLRNLKKAKKGIDFSWNKTISNLHKIKG